LRRAERLEDTIGLEANQTFQSSRRRRAARSPTPATGALNSSPRSRRPSSQLHGMGPGAINVLRRALSKRGLSFLDARFAPDRRVDLYIDSLAAWQQAICHEVRALVHAADPEVTETIKRTKLPYFVLEGNICALLAAKDHANVFLYDGAIVPDPAGIVTSGHKNKTARTVAVRQDERINAPALTSMFKAIIANNRAGGWRKLKREA
jgi:hypothetical protein